MKKRNRIPIIIGTLALSASVFAGGLVMTNAANNDDGCYEDKYYNAYQAYDRLKQNEKTTITQDTKCNQIWWVRQHHDAEVNTSASDESRQNEGCVGYILGWRVVISAVDSSNKTYTMTCDLPDAERDTYKAVTEFENANDTGMCKDDKDHYYTLYALDLNTLYDYMAANNASTAEAINKCSNADIYIYPIATYRYGIAEPAGSITYNNKGITGTSGKVYYGDNKTEWDKLDAYLMEKNGRVGKFPDSGFFQCSYDGKISAEPGECTYRFELGDTSDTKLQKSELNFKPGWSVNKDGYLYHNNQLYKSYHKLLKTDPLVDASEFSVGGDAANLRTGYTINNGWYVNGTENKAGVFGDRGYGRNIKDAGGNMNNEVLTCKWQEHSYTIEYDSNGGSGFVSQATPKYSEQINLSDGTGLYRSGYNFAGWSTNPNATEPDTIRIDGKDIKFVPRAQVSKLLATDGGASIKLYAVWQPGEYDR